MKTNQNLTTKQKLAITEMVANGGKMKQSEILRKAGYSHSMVRNPQRVFKSPMVVNLIEKEMNEYLTKLILHRDQVIDAMIAKIHYAKYGELTNSLKTIREIISQLEGKIPNSIQILLPESEQKRIQELLNL